MRASSSTAQGSPAADALHIGAMAAGERPLDWKPNVSWQVPLRLEHSTDENGHVTSRLREWKRRDWGEGGRSSTGGARNRPRRSSGRTRVPVVAQDDIVALVGAPIYDLLVQQLERPEWVPPPPGVPQDLVTEISRRLLLGADVLGFENQRFQFGGQPEGVRQSVVLLGVVVVELDAVLLGQGGVLVVLVRIVLWRCPAGCDLRDPDRTPRDQIASASSPLRSGDDDPSSPGLPRTSALTLDASLPGRPVRRRAPSSSGMCQKTVDQCGRRGRWSARRAEPGLHL